MPRPRQEHQYDQKWGPLRQMSPRLPPKLVNRALQIHQQDTGANLLGGLLISLLEQYVNESTQEN